MLTLQAALGKADSTTGSTRINSCLFVSGQWWLRYEPLSAHFCWFAKQLHAVLSCAALWQVEACLHSCQHVPNAAAAGAVLL